MDLGLKNKVIVVSGASRGIGRAIVQVLSAEGAMPVGIDRAHSDNPHHFIVNLASPDQCVEVINAIINKYGQIDGLVNNAGINDGFGLEHGNYEKFMQSMHSNLVHYYMLANAALPALKKNKGSIVNIVSKLAETGQGGTSAYAAANGGRAALTREWAVELLKYGMRVNGVVVAECYTPMYEEYLSKMENPAEMLEKINSRIPLGNRMTTAEEIANAVVFLLSDKSSHTTGQLLHVDGGYVHLDRAI